MFSKTSFEIGRIFGVPVKVDFSLLLVAGMFVLSYSRAMPNSPGTSLVAGLLSAAALVVALLVHEVGHAAAALSRGCRVHEITLMFFGGRAVMSGLPSAPLARAAISLAGPAAGLLLWFVALRLSVLLGGLRILPFLLGEAARISLYLSIFNMLPALPLDGGHVLRDVLAHFKGNAFATFVVAKVSRGIAIAMGLYGLFLGGGFIMVILAFFIWASAKSEIIRAANGGDPDGLDDDVVIISPPPYGKEKEYTRIKRR